jgi:predicted PurR-regulated permease PerM
MTLLIIILIVFGLVIAALAIIATIVSLANQRCQRDNASLHRSLQDEQRRAAQWSEEATRLAQEHAALQEQNADLSEALENTRLIYNKLLAAHHELQARNTALVKAMEAQPTQPKRTVRKNSTAGGEQ